MLFRGLVAASLSLFVFNASRGYCASSASFARSDSPTVQLDNGTFVGNRTSNVTQFLGIPYALPPVGDLRLRLPVPNAPYNGTYNASYFGPACPQLPFTFNPSVASTIAPIFESIEGFFATSNNTQSEDCLTVDVVVPNNVTSSVKFPVVVWIYEGGFQAGDTSEYPGKVIVEGSLNQHTPVIYVAMNYRMAAFGFLPGEEVKEAGVGNLGLHDQRLALRWVQKYISAFGGDPDRVTIWGESAGAMSVGMHMVWNGGDTEGLFHGAFMQSGSLLPVGDIADTTHQAVYNSFVEGAGCSNSTDALQCLREVPFSVFNNVSSETYSTFGYQSLALSFGPRTDGVFLTDSPQHLVLKGEVARVPFVIGDCDDEGTVFALGNVDIITDEETENYIASNFFTSASKQDLQPLFAAYPSDPTAGSPFDTGSANNLTGQYKRLAAFEGDIAFQVPRRFFLQQRSAQQNTWSYLWKRGKSTAYVGAFHVSDSHSTYGPDPGELRDALINFVTNLDPNGQTLIDWPKYTTDEPTLFTFSDGPDGEAEAGLTNDTFRVDAMNILLNISLAHPI